MGWILTFTILTAASGSLFIDALHEDRWAWSGILFLVMTSFAYRTYVLYKDYSKDH